MLVLRDYPLLQQAVIDNSEPDRIKIVFPAIQLMHIRRTSAPLRLLLTIPFIPHNFSFINLRPAHLLSDLERGSFLLALYFAPTVWYNVVNQDGIPDRLDAQGIFKYGSNLLQRRFIWHSRHMPEYGVDTSKHTWICKRGNFYGSHSTGGRRLRDDEPQRELLCATVQGLNIRVTPCRCTPATSHQHPYGLPHRGGSFIVRRSYLSSLTA